MSTALSIARFLWKLLKWPLSAVWLVLWVIAGAVLYLVALLTGALWGAWAWLAPGLKARHAALNLPPYWTPGNR